MNALKHVLKTISILLLVMGFAWFIITPSPTLAAEDHYKIPGWACKPSNHFMTYPWPPQTDPPQVMYDQLRGRVFNNDPRIEQLIVCPLHVKKQMSRIKKVLVYYTDNNRQANVRCTLYVRGRNKKAFETTKGPSGSGKGFLTIANDFSDSEEIYMVQCTLPRKTELGTSSIDNIHVYQEKLGEACAHPFGACSDQSGVAPAAMPAVACHPLTERSGIQYSYDAKEGMLENASRARPLQVICPIVRDNTKTKQSPTISVEMDNRNPNHRFRATCTTWVTGSSQPRSIRMRWIKKNNEGGGAFQTARKVTINSNDSFSVICSIPPARGTAAADRSRIHRVKWSE